MSWPPSDFEAITECAPLVAELRERIRATGPIPFRDFMEAALYHPRFGYYTSGAVAMHRGGDYVTSPEVHPVFGALVARQLHEMWQVLSRPPRFDVVEQGAGSGVMARDILACAAARQPAFAAAIAYSIVEISPELRARQQATTARASEGAGPVRWRDALPDEVAGCIVSNELVDSFPVHRVARRGADLLELYVALDDAGRFVDQLDELSTPELRQYFDDLGLLPGDGCSAEVNLAARDWMRRVGASLRRGYVLTLDYGYEAHELYAPWRRDGTLVGFYRQAAGSDPYQRIGKQDLTSSVDFTTLRRAGEQAGLRTVGLTDQGRFLVRLGLTEGLAEVAGAGSGEMEEYFARRRVVMDLIDPAGLGRIKVLAQTKDAPHSPFSGFHDG